MTKQGIIVKFEVVQDEVGMYHDALYHYMTNDGNEGDFLACWPFIKTATFQIQLDTITEAKTFISQYVTKFIKEMEDNDNNYFWKEKYLSETKHGKFPDIKINLIHTSEDGEFDYYAR